MKYRKEHSKLTSRTITFFISLVMLLNVLTSSPSSSRLLKTRTWSRSPAAVIFILEPTALMGLVKAFAIIMLTRITSSTVQAMITHDYSFIASKNE